MMLSVGTWFKKLYLPKKKCSDYDASEYDVSQFDSTIGENSDTFTQTQPRKCYTTIPRDWINL